MEVIKQVKECMHSCDFYGNSMDGMECNHPYFDKKDAYANMIISQDDRGKVPVKCPLRRENLLIEYIIGIQA